MPIRHLVPASSQRKIPGSIQINSIKNLLFDNGECVRIQESLEGDVGTRIEIASRQGRPGDNTLIAYNLLVMLIYTRYTLSDGSDTQKKVFYITYISDIYTQASPMCSPSSLPSNKPHSISLASLLADIAYLAMLFIYSLGDAHCWQCADGRCG